MKIADTHVTDPNVTHTIRAMLRKQQAILALLASFAQRFASNPAVLRAVNRKREETLSRVDSYTAALARQTCEVPPLV